MKRWKGIDGKIQNIILRFQKFEGARRIELGGEAEILHRDPLILLVGNHPLPAPRVTTGIPAHAVRKVPSVAPGTPS